MIDKNFWTRIAAQWCKESDGIDIPDDRLLEAQKAASISDEDLDFFSGMSDAEIDDILADLDIDLQ